MGDGEIHRVTEFVMILKYPRCRLLLLTTVTTAGMAFGVADLQAAIIGSTPATNDILGIREGWFEANLYLNSADDVNATIELLGSEAGAINTLDINGSPEFSFQGFSGANLQSVVLSPGLLNMLFTTNLTGAIAANGSNVSPATGLPNFFVTFGAEGDSSVDGSTPDSGTVVLIALDDSGSGPDDDYDDLIVRLTVTAGSVAIFPLPVPVTLALSTPSDVTVVPEPASFTLFGMGLFSLVWVFRPRRI